MTCLYIILYFFSSLSPFCLSVSFFRWLRCFFFYYYYFYTASVQFENVLNGSQLGFVITVFLYFSFMILLSVSHLLCLCFKTRARALCLSFSSIFIASLQSIHFCSFKEKKRQQQQQHTATWSVRNAYELHVVHVLSVLIRWRTNTVASKWAFVCALSLPAIFLCIKLCRISTTVHNFLDVMHMRVLLAHFFFIHSFLFLFVAASFHSDITRFSPFFSSLLHFFLF